MMAVIHGSAFKSSLEAEVKQKPAWIASLSSNVPLRRTQPGPSARTRPVADAVQASGSGELTK